MSDPLLLTKIFIPPPRPKSVSRPHLIQKINESLLCKLTLISAPAGFGKTTLVSDWVAGCGQPVAWLSLDKGDNDPARFLIYLIVALQTINTEIGTGLLVALRSPQPPPPDMILTTLLNEITTFPNNFNLVLDDYHMIESKVVDSALTFLIEHLPPQMHLIIATREDPHLPLARLRARGQSIELRAADLRFTPAEAAEFLNQVIGLNLTEENITALESRTEGWIAGLQLASLAMQTLQGRQDTSSFIESFTGSHHFVLDYLIEEVLQQQSEIVLTFLLSTSILERMCGSLCETVLGNPSVNGQEILEYLEHANLFIVPLDNERRWYRYHHLFAELLRQRLQLSLTPKNEVKSLSEYHIRASQWFEDNGLELEAFRHATVADDVERVEHIIEGKGIPLYVRGALVPICNWLASLPLVLLSARPSLGVMYATLTLMGGQTTGVEEKLRLAELALTSTQQQAMPIEKTRDLIGQIAAARATLALTRYQPEDMITQAQRALDYLHPDNQTSRVRAIWTLGFAHQVLGDRIGARQAFSEAVAISQASGNIRFTIVATISLAVIQEFENHLHQAVETYQSGLQLAGDYPQPFENEAHLGLARIFYEWNDLVAAEKHGQQALQLARQFDRVIDRFIRCEVFLARLKLAQGDVIGAAVMLAETEQSVRQNNFVHRMPEVAAAQVLVLLRQGDFREADHLAQKYDLSLSQARVHLAQGNPSASLEVLESYSQRIEAKGWVDEHLKVLVLKAVALDTHDEKEKAVHLLGEALKIANPEGFTRLFLDEGPPMAHLLSEAASQGVKQDYIGKLLAEFEALKGKSVKIIARPLHQHLVEPLSLRELEILHLLAKGLSNRVIAERLFLALDTIKGHNRNIFNKLEVQSRAEAVIRARELGLL